MPDPVNRIVSDARRAQRAHADEMERVHRQRREAEEYRDGAALVGARNALVVTTVIVLAVLGALWLGGAL
jgi:hypothetical protein